MRVPRCFSLTSQRRGATRVPRRALVAVLALGSVAAPAATADTLGPLIPIPNTREIAAAHGYVWVTADGGLVRIDAATGSAVPPIPVAEELRYLAADGGGAWVVESRPIPEPSFVVRVTLDGRIAARVQVGANPLGLAVGGGSVWVADTDAVTRIDARRMEVVARIRVNCADEIAFGAGFAWAHCGALLYEIDPRTNKAVAKFEDERLDVWTMQEARAGSVWFLRTFTDWVVRLRLKGGVPDAVTVPGLPDDEPRQARVGAGSVWVTDSTYTRVNRFDARTLRRLKPIRVSASGIAIAGRRVWFADARGRGVRAFTVSG